jgi:transcriptional regulator with XRE-family HTH domain
MPKRGQPVTHADTKLAHARAKRGVTQPQLAAAIGISLATYRRLERGEQDNPPLRYLSNAAICLDMRLEDLIEDDWRTWATLDQRATRPPDWR